MARHISNKRRREIQRKKEAEAIKQAVETQNKCDMHNLQLLSQGTRKHIMKLKSVRRSPRPGPAIKHVGNCPILLEEPFITKDTALWYIRNMKPRFVIKDKFDKNGSLVRSGLTIY